MARYRKQQIDIPLTQGINQAIESRLAAPGGMKSLTNAIFDKQGRLAKRRRFTTSTLTTIGGSALAGSSTATYPRKLASFQDRLLFPTNYYLFELDSSINRVGSRGYMPETGAPSRKPIAHNSKNEITHAGMQISAAGYRVYAWIVEGTTAGQGEVWASIHSPEGAHMTTQLISSSGATARKLRVLKAGSYIMLVWLQSTNTLVYSRLDFSGAVPASITWPAASTISTTVQNHSMDACTLSDITYFAYTDTGNILRILRYNSAMAQTHNAGFGALATSPTAVGCFADSSGLCVAFVESAATKAVIVSAATLTTVQGVTTVIPTSAAPIWNGGIGTAVINDPDTAGTYVIYGHYPEGAVGSPLNSPLIWGATFNTAGTVVTDGSPIWHLMLVSRLFVRQGRVYGVLHTPSSTLQLDGSYWLCEMFFGDAGTTFMPRPVAALAIDGFGSANVWGTGGVREKASFNEVVADTISSAYELALPETYKMQGALWSYPGVPGPWVTLDQLTVDGISAYSFDFLDPEAGQAVEFGRATFFSGGLLMQYDGNRPVEVGFCYRPQRSDATVVAGANSYNYLFTYGWRDAQGQWHESAPGALLVVTAAAAPNASAATIDCNTLTLSYREDDGVALSIRPNSVKIRVWRTTNAGTVFYLAGEVQNDRDTEYVSFTDNVSDTTLATKEALYSQPGANQAHGTANCAQDICIWRNRLVACKDNVVRFTNEWLGDWAPQFVRGLTHEVQVSSGKPVTAIDAVDESLVAFKKGEIHLISGEPPAPNGTPPLPPPRQLSSDQGCENASSLLQSRVGLFFKSAAGIFLLPRGFGPPVWVGEAVRDEFGDPRHPNAIRYPYVVDTANVPSRNLALFLLSSTYALGSVTSKILVFDYNRNAWTTWTVPSDAATASVLALDPGNPYTVDDGETLYFTDCGSTSQSLVVESPTEADEDNAHVTLTLETHKYRPAGQATGFARGYALRILGGVEGSAAPVSTKLSLEVAVDDGSYQTAETWTLDSYSLDGTFVLEHILKYPRANSFQFKITDLTDSGGNPNCGPVLNALTFDVVALPGGKPTAAANRS